MTAEVFIISCQDFLTEVFVNTFKKSSFVLKDKKNYQFVRDARSLKLLPELQVKVH